MAIQDDMDYLSLLAKINQNLNALREVSENTISLNERVSAPLVSLNKVRVLDSLPESGDDTTLYLVMADESGDESGDSSNTYEEYIWYDNAFEKLGSVTKNDLNTLKVEIKDELQTWVGSNYIPNTTDVVVYNANDSTKQRILVPSGNFQFTVPDGTIHFVMPLQTKGLPSNVGSPTAETGSVNGQIYFWASNASRWSGMENVASPNGYAVGDKLVNYRRMASLYVIPTDGSTAASASRLSINSFTETTTGKRFNYGHSPSFDFVAADTLFGGLNDAIVNFDMLNNTANSVVHKNGTETIDGEKTFTSRMFLKNGLMTRHYASTTFLDSAINGQTLGMGFRDSADKLLGAYALNITSTYTEALMYSRSYTSDANYTNNTYNQTEFKMRASKNGASDNLASLVLGGGTFYVQGNILPSSTGIVNNVSPYSLGSDTYRWNNVYNSTGVISTSDERVKTEIADIPEAALKAWGKVKFKQFKFKDAVAKKGANARLHTGVIAQDIIRAFQSEGLTESDAMKYGLLCYDAWEDKYEDVEVIDTPAERGMVKVIDSQAMYNTETDENGNEIQVEVMPEKSHMEEQEIKPAVTHMEKRKVLDAGNMYSVRYEECLVFECAYQRWLGEQREAELTSLKEKLAALDAKLSQ